MNDCPILNCNPKAPIGKAYLQWLMVPAYAWKVILVSSKQQEELDVFEKLIFNLMKSGSYEISKLAKDSHLDQDLIKILLEQLHSNGWLAKDGENNYRCCRGNEDDNSTSEEMGEQTVGWILQQSWNGLLFPAFYPRLPIQPTSVTGGSTGDRRLTFGDEADSFERWAHCLNFPSHIALKPTPLDIKRAIGFRGSREFKERQAALREIPRQTKQDAIDKYPDNIKRVKFLSTEPTPVYLATAALVFDSEPGDWHVCCPVGTGLSHELRHQIIKSSEDSDSGAEVIINQLCSQTRHGDIYEWANARRDFVAHARRETLLTFGPAIENFPDILEQVDAFHDLWARLRGTEGEPPQHLMEPVFSAARKTFEALVKVFAIQRPISDLHTCLANKDECGNTCMVIKWLNEVGYVTDGIDGLFVVSKTWLQKSADDSANYYMLKNVIGAIALQAKVQTDHPLRIAVGTNPSLFVEVKSLLALGNAASHDNSHGSDKQTKLTKDVALSIREPLARIIRALLDPDRTIFK